MDDERYIARAFELARLAEGRVSPRPPVGSVLVSPGGEIVGEGWSKDGAGRHAEVHAVADAGARAKGTTCYATVEPCLKWCTPALIDAGVTRVVASIADPNPKVDGLGFATLRDAGITVDVGLGADEARDLYAPFTKWITTGRPFVTLKLAASLDGKVAAPDGTSRWITGEDARAEVHELRRRVDAVMVGSGTVLADDPLLTFRSDAEGDQPLRVVLDSNGRIPKTMRVFNDDAPTVVYTRADVPAADGGVDLDAVLDDVAQRGVCHLLVEGGPTLAASFLEQGLVDRLLLYLAPKIIGGDAPGLFASGVKTLVDAWPLDIKRTRRVGDDMCIEAEVR